MSMLHVGAKCAACTTVDFLPLTCQFCALTFCRDHIHSHQCSEATTSAHTLDHSASSSFARRDKCELSGCDNLSIEAIGGRRTGADAENIAKEVRCPGCQKAFCTAHRQQQSHSCSGPKDYTVRSDAAEVRKTIAQEILAKNFPQHTGRNIPKPVTKEDTRTRPKSPERIPPSLQASSAAGTNYSGGPQVISGNIGGASKKVKSKAEKLYEIHLRKVRSTAKPLDPKQKAGPERRFVEWGCTSIEKVQGWRESGKIDVKLERVWVNSEMPAGKVLDLMIDQAKVPRSRAESPQQWCLLSLSSLPDNIRKIQRLDLSKPVALVDEGCTVVLVKDDQRGI